MIKLSSKAKRLQHIVISLVMLILLLSSIVFISFHNHPCDKNTDNCAICNFQSSYYAVTVSQDTGFTLLFKPISQHAVTLNERATDPSRTLVCSVHAPPQNF
jgi:hypothetical protein